MFVLLHIGYPKTGTRWFQNKFFPFVKNAIYFPNYSYYKSFIDINPFKFETIKVRELFTGNDTKLSIISNHGFIGTTHNFGLNGYLTSEHARRLVQVFPKAHIILFIRNQLDIIASTYIQYIKEGGTYSINKYLYHKNFKGINSISMFSFSHFEYHHIIQLYKKLFGDNNVSVFLFEEFVEDQQAFIKKIKQKFDLKVETNSLDYSHVNRGYRKGVKSLAMITNHFTEKKMQNKHYFFHLPGWWEISKKILDRLNQYSIFGHYITSNDILNKENIEYIKTYYRKSNNFLIDEFDLSYIRKYNYPL